MSGFDFPYDDEPKKATTTALCVDITKEDEAQAWQELLQECSAMDIQDILAEMRRKF